MECGDILLAVPMEYEPTETNLWLHGVRGILISRDDGPGGLVSIRTVSGVESCRVPRPPVYLSISDFSEAEQAAMAPLRWMLLEKRDPPSAKRCSPHTIEPEVIRFNRIKRSSVTIWPAR